TRRSFCKEERRWQISWTSPGRRKWRSSRKIETHLPLAGVECVVFYYSGQYNSTVFGEAIKSIPVGNHVTVIVKASRDDSALRARYFGGMVVESIQFRTAFDRDASWAAWRLEVV